MALTGALVFAGQQIELHLEFSIPNRHRAVEDEGLLSVRSIASGEQ
jgi:hypothetical protein